MELWVAELQGGRPEAAWDLFLNRYRRLIFAAIRHYAEDYDDVMDVFARVCEAMREKTSPICAAARRASIRTARSPLGSSRSSTTSPSIGSATSTAADGSTLGRPLFPP